MPEKCALSPSGSHHYVAVIGEEKRTTLAEIMTVTYQQIIFCVQCGAKL